MESIFNEALKHSTLMDANVSTLVWLTLAGFIAAYLLYILILAAVLDWTTVSVTLSVHARRGSIPPCATCARTSLLGPSWQTFDFSFSVPNGEPARVRFVNDFRENDDTCPGEEPSPTVNRLVVHDCGGFEEVYLEMACSRGPLRLMCLPSEDYPNIMMEEVENRLVRLGGGMTGALLATPYTAYAVWGKLELGGKKKIENIPTRRPRRVKSRQPSPPIVHLCRRTDADESLFFRPCSREYCSVQDARVSPFVG